MLQMRTRLVLFSTALTLFFTVGENGLAFALQVDEGASESSADVKTAPEKEPKEKLDGGEEVPPEQTQGFGSGVPEDFKVTHDGFDFLGSTDVDTRLRSDDIGLLGDQIDPNTGSLNFEHIDISIPGNSDLEVALRRKRVQGDPWFSAEQQGFADWSVSVPTFSFSYARYDRQGNHSQLPHPDWGTNCFLNYPAGFSYEYQVWTSSDTYSFYAWIEPETHSTGHLLSVPGRANNENFGIDRVAKSKNDWTIRCETGPGGAPQLVATAPNGDAYKFTRHIYRTENYYPLPYELTWSSTTVPYRGEELIIREHVVLLATEVTDLDGNWVRYEYTNDERAELTRIHSNDGREITLSYNTTMPNQWENSRRITQVTANGRTWIYNYTTAPSDTAYLPGSRNYLASVTLPDGRQWVFDDGGGLTGMSVSVHPAFECGVREAEVKLKHPNGVTGLYNLKDTRHLKNEHGGAYTTPNPSTFDVDGWEWYLDCETGEGYQASSSMHWRPEHWPIFNAMSLQDKTLFGPGYTAATWNYEYSGFTNGAIPLTKWTEITDPFNITTRRNYHRYGDFMGLLEKSVVSGPAGIAETFEMDYVVEPLANTPSPGNPSNTDTILHPYLKRPVNLATTTRGSDVYNTRYTYNLDYNDLAYSSPTAYSFGKPTKVEKWSNVVSGTRVTDISYVHFLTDWRVGLPDKVKRNNIEFDDYDYDTLGRPVTHKKFGTTWRTFTYSNVAGEMGALNTVTDAASEVVTFSNYKRGMPQIIERADGAFVYRTVDDNGWVASETDARGYATSYDYNDVGWLTEIDRPGAHADTAIAYQGLGNGLTQIATTGSVEEKTWYDGLLRPYRERRKALSGGGGTINVATEYDAMSRVAFQSLPDATYPILDGTRTVYDALGRPLTVTQTAGPDAVTSYQYLSQNRTLVTDPELHQSTTWSSGYGSPDDGAVVKVVDALGATTQMDRDIYGKIERLYQYGTQNGYTASVERFFYYDARQRLCRHRAPEMGDEVFGYDSLDRMAWEASGQPWGGTGCALSPPADATEYEYDVLNRIERIDYPPGTDDIVYNYDLNGNIKNIYRGAVWSYNYDALNRITKEKLDIDGRTYDHTYVRNANGFVESRGRNGTPGYMQLTYNPDGLGRPKKVAQGETRYLYAAAYHPNEQVSGLEYGNGHELEQSLNARGLVQLVRHGGGGAGDVVRLNYAYDDRYKVDAITDHVNAGENRTFDYDGAGRLLTATGPWGVSGAQATASYKYDALNNIRKRTVGPRVVDIDYNAANRVDDVTDTGAPFRDFAHDARGNVTNDGRYAITYDAADQPVSMTGSGVNAAYAYDGNKRRVKSVAGGKTTYFVYSAVTGGLIFKDEATDLKTTDYAGIGPAQVRIENGSTAIYTYGDHLGSPVAATDGSGSVLWREFYHPFGEAMNYAAGANDDNPGFTGHIDDAATGLTYMQARYYDPVIGRFYSTDPIGYRDQLNLYAYVHNDPVNAWDPTGEETEVELRGEKLGPGYGHLTVVATDTETGEQFTAEGGPTDGGGAKGSSEPINASGGVTDSLVAGSVLPGDRTTGRSGLETIDRTTVDADIDDVRTSVEGYTSDFNEAGADYGAVSGPNSNTYATGAYRAGTGREANMEGRSRAYPASDTDNPAERNEDQSGGSGW